VFESLKKAIKNFSDSITTRELSEKEIESAVNEFVHELIQNDVAYDVAIEIANEIRLSLKDVKIGRFTNSHTIIESKMKESLTKILEIVKPPDFYQLVSSIIKEKGLCTVVFFGVNGSGKTTTIAKLAFKLKEKGFLPIIAAADTFRAGAIEQIKSHAEKIGVPVYLSKYGSDPASVAFGCVQEARKNKRNVVLIDTAGRMNTDTDLIQEMKKIVRVSKPDLKIFVGDSLVGNDAVNQIRTFNSDIGIDGVIITKMDADSHGGLIFSVARIIKKPIYFIGIGQDYSSLIEFSPEVILKKLF